MLRLVLKKISKFFLYFFGISILWVIVYRFVPPPITILMIQRNIVQLMDSKELKLKKDWVPKEEISVHLKYAVIASEDQLFYEHFGFDFKALKKAIEKNKKGKRLKGASTITQQVAKNVFLWPSRDWIRKGFEAYFTFLIEVFWSKERILEVYLNEIEMGDGIYGAEAAAQSYFGKSAKKLSRSQSALIAAILPNPRRWSAKNPNAFIMRRQQWILRNMSNLGY